jgi:hypothetical protein
MAGARSKLLGSDLPDPGDMAVVPPVVGQGTSQQTARRAVALLLAKGLGFHEPTKAERRAISVGFAMRGRVIYGAAFDLVRLSAPVDLKDSAAVAEAGDAITIYEVKSTNRANVGPDFGGYFFSLSTAEFLVAQNLGPQFRLAFVNVTTGEHIERSLTEVFDHAKGIYPTWSIKF